MAFATNYMGHFLLSRGLTDLIHKSSVELSQGVNDINQKFYGRIINVASAFHYQPDGRMLRPISENGRYSTPEAARSDMNTLIHR
jgi:NAD(P)-dependent dehydrogenase (short-subunit alcohol dehydrogenase family)